jgi:glycosyltransferase involved in cell wall biosynthesis
MGKKILFIPSWYPVFGSNGGEYFTALFELYQKQFPEVSLLYIELDYFPEKNKLLKVWRLLPFRISRIFIKLQLLFIKLPDIIDSKLFLRVTTPFEIEKQELYYTHLRLAYEFVFKKLFCDYNFIAAQSAQFAGLIAFHLHKKYPMLQYSITEHNYFSSGRFSISLWPSVRDSFKNAKNVYFCSHDKMRQVLATGIEINVRRRVVNFNYVKSTNDIVKPYVPLNQLNIITVASASHFKDLPTLFETIQLLRVENIDYHFTLVGFGIWGNKSKYLPNELMNKIESNISLISSLNHLELMDEYKKNNIFLLTSIAEGMPVSLLEAMELGLLAVVTKHGGSEEVVIDGLNGAVREIGDSTALCDALKKIYYGNIRHVPELNKRRAHLFSSADSYIKRTFVGL